MSAPQARIMIQKSFLDKGSLERYITEYFKPDKNLQITVLPNKLAQYRLICSYDWRFYFEEESEDTTWDSYLLGSDFRFEQEVHVDLEKSKADTDQYALLFGFIRFLKEKTDGDILFDADDLEELCLFHGDEIIYSENGKFLEGST